MEPALALRRLAASSLLRRVAAACPECDLFLTGGSLRDRLLGATTHDLDLVVRADAARCAAALARSFGGSRFTLGRPPALTHRIVAGPLQIDLCEAEGALRDDILRRDFTVNALFWRLPRGPLTDLVGGVEDLAAGRIRVVREENLADDPLRVLRGVRLLATRPQLKLTQETEHHLAAAASGLSGVARERIVDELRRMLGGPAAERAVLTVARLELLAPLVRAWRSYPNAAPLAAVARELAALARGRQSPLAAGAAGVALAVAAAPAAGFPARWRAGGATAALRRLGVGEAAARRMSAAVGIGERLRLALESGALRARELAVAAGPGLPGALAWAVARRRAEGADVYPAAGRLLRWARGFDRRPPLLGGEEVAAILRLPPDGRRAEAVGALRLAQARGRVRSRGQALAFLRTLAPR